MTPRAKGAFSFFLKIFGVFLFLIAVILALGWFVLDGSTTRPRVVRSRLTIVVETPEGERTGSSVTQQTTSFPGGLTRAQGWAIWVDLVGEAAVVDLGQRGLLVATLVMPSWLTQAGWSGGGGYNAGLAPFPREKFLGTHSSNDDEYVTYLDNLKRLKPKAELGIKDVPVLVKFSSPNDPTSAELVDPLNLAASLGPGVTFKGATVEITDDPITHSIETRLPWLKSSKFNEGLFPKPDPWHRDQERPLVTRFHYNAFRELPR
jgi:hypothetical protein